MAHFAELDSNNIVLRVLCLDNFAIENEQGQRVEQLGIDFLQKLYGPSTIWAQTSYNTRAGIYYIPGTNQASPDQSQAFRKNYAGRDYSYDLTRDAFIPPQPSAFENGDEWLLNEEECTWFDPKVPLGCVEIKVARV